MMHSFDDFSLCFWVFGSAFQLNGGFTKNIKSYHIFRHSMAFFIAFLSISKAQNNCVLSGPSYLVGTTPFCSGQCSDCGRDTCTDSNVSSDCVLGSKVQCQSCHCNAGYFSSDGYAGFDASAIT